MNTAAIAPIITRADEGRALWHLGALLNFKALGSETGGRFWAAEGLADSNMGVPLNIHEVEDEAWYVLEGTIEFYVGKQMTIGGPGSFVYIPHGVPHSFKVRTGTARWFGIGTPAILDGFFFETGVPAESLNLPPAPPPPSEEDIAVLTASLLSHGTVTIGPPPQ